jgi:ribonuclease BN (tRNA processing enzyme)
LKIEYLTSTAGFRGRSMNLTTYLINETFAVDAGVLGLWASPDRQARVRDILLTHSHLDHVGTLPMFLDNVYAFCREPIRIHLTRATHRALEELVFRKETWTEWKNLAGLEPALLEISLFEPGDRLTIQGIDIDTLLVDHSVECVGLLLHDEWGSVAISSDTGPTQAFWSRCRETGELRAVFLECSFPSSLEGLARTTCHLTPTLFAGEMAKLDRPVRWIAMHLKPSYHAEVASELARIGVEIVQPGFVYDFGEPGR